MKFPTQDDVAAEVRAHLARHGWSGRRMALRLGWTQAYMGRRLSGDVPFNVTDLAAIAQVLEVPVAAFFDGPGARRPPRHQRSDAAAGGQLRKQPLAAAA